MTVTKLVEEEKIIFALKGRLDVNASLQMQEVLIHAFDESTDITLDFTELVYLSSAGLRVLIAGQKKAEAKGASMIITGVSDEIMEVFEITGLVSVFKIV